MFESDEFVFEGFGERTSLTVLSDNVVARGVQEYFKDFDDVGVVKFFENVDLIHDFVVFCLRDCCLFENFDGSIGFGSLMDSFVDFSIATFSNLIQQSVVPTDIFLPELHEAFFPDFDGFEHIFFTKNISRKLPEDGRSSVLLLLFLL